jgi:hypothetical protein
VIFFNREFSARLLKIAPKKSSGGFLSFFSLLALCSFFSAPQAALAAGITQYPLNTTNTIGEFIYNDDFVAATTSCSISIYSPSNLLLVNNVALTTTSDNGWQSYSFAPTSTEGVYPAAITCGTLVGGDLAKIDKTFTITSSGASTSSIATSVWSSAARTLTSGATIATDVWSAGTRTLTGFGTLVTDIWSDITAPTRRLTDSTLTGGGTIATESYIATALNTATSSIITEVLANRSLINALNNISASDVWAASTRSLTNYGTSSIASAIWEIPTTTLTSLGSVGRLLATNLDAQVSSRGTSTLSAADVWNSAARTLTDYSTTSLSLAVWSNAARTLTNYGNDITAAEVWSILTSTLSVAGTIGQQLAANTDIAASTIRTEVLTNRSLINALNNISANDVWAAGSRTLTDYSTSTIATAIWQVPTTTLTSLGSVGRLLATNLDAQVSSRGTSTLSAADVWNTSVRTLTDYSTTSLALAVWSNAARTLTNYGNNITAADVWSVLTSTLTTASTIGNFLTANIDVAASTRASLSNQTAGFLVTMSNIDSVAAGNTYRAKIYVLNSNSVPTASFTVPAITIYDADRNVIISGASMTSIATGVYEYTYSISSAATGGLWESSVSTQVESGKTITTNDYWLVATSPAQVIINSVTSSTAPDVSANVTITNEGTSGYEYHYEWCVVQDLTNPCGGSNDVWKVLMKLYYYINICQLSFLYSQIQKKAGGESGFRDQF